MNLGRFEKAFGSDAIGEPNCPDKAGYPVLLGEDANQPLFGGRLSRNGRNLFISHTDPAPQAAAAHDRCAGSGTSTL
jgi:hypothetical protein